MDVIGAVFEGSNAKKVVQKIFDEPHDCTGLHFIHRERKVAQSQLGSINLEERERNREKNKKNPHLVIKAKGCGQKRGII